MSGHIVDRSVRSLIDSLSALQPLVLIRIRIGYLDEPTKFCKTHSIEDSV